MSDKGLNIVAWVRSFPRVRWLIIKAKTSSLPGLQGVRVFDIINFIYNESIDDDINTRANSAAYSFFLSLFPAILLLISIGSLLPFDIVDWFRSTIEGVLPNSAEEFLFQIIGNIEQLPHTGLLSIGLILAIYFSSNGILTLMRGFHKSYEMTFKDRTWIKEQLIAMLLTGLMFLLLIASAILLITGNSLISYLASYVSLDGFETFMLQILKWVLVISLFYSAIALIYKLGPSMHRKFRFFSPGATVTTFVVIILTLGFSVYVNNFGTYNKLYGSIGAVIVLLVWIKLVCMIILLGFELNASIAVHKDLRSKNHESRPH